MDDFNPLQLIASASLPVQIVMAILLLASISSWWIIFGKRTVIARARKDADDFEERFWSGVDLAALFREISAERTKVAGLESVFEAGFREFARTRQRKPGAGDRMLEGAERAMRVALSRELDYLENHLSFLATVGSTSPYVGLFGTVWAVSYTHLTLPTKRIV